MLEVINRYLHGYVAIPVIYCCYKNGLFELLHKKALTLEEISQQLNANDGYLQVVLRMLKQLNWVKQEQNLYKLIINEKIEEEIAKIPDIISIYKLPIHDFINTRKNKKLTIYLDYLDIQNNDDSNLPYSLLEGVLLVPLLLSLRLDFFNPIEKVLYLDNIPPLLKNKILEIFKKRRWFNIQKNELTDAGYFMLDRALNMALAASYAPMLSKIDELLFGNPLKVFKRNIHGHETHIDRNLNLLSSSFQHERYFADIEDIIINIFNNKNLLDQPKYIIDMGCGDGSLLKKIYGLIVSKTKRGKVIEEFPIYMIGVDYNKKALKLSDQNLKGIPHLSIQGDIANPEKLMTDLRKLNLSDIENSLHVRSFLDHDRPYISPKNKDELKKYNFMHDIGAFVDSNGKVIPPEEMFQSLKEHLIRWSRILNRHGIIILEVHCLQSNTVRKFFNQSESFYFDALQAFSKQYPVRADIFTVAAASAGLFPETNFSRRYPQTFPYIRITLNYFVKKPYQLDYAHLSDLDSLLYLENQCWEKHLRVTKNEIIQRIQNFPQGQFVIRMDNKIIAVIYTQRINNIKLLHTVSFRNISTLHEENGNILQLIGINLIPTMQGQGLGDYILEFILLWSSLIDGIEKLIGVTRCKNYLEHPKLTLQEYVNKHAITPQGIDSILRFHTSHGAKIIDIIQNYRPEDYENLGSGILVEYDLHHVFNNPAKLPYLKIKNKIPDIIKQSIFELLPEKYKPNYSNKIPLRDMGFDSLRLLELRTILNQKLNVKLDPTIFFQNNTPEEMIHNFIKFTPSYHEIEKKRVTSNVDNDAIAIIGIGCRFPGNVNNIDEFWQILKSGQDTCSKVPIERGNFLTFDAAKYGAFINNIDMFDADFFHISPREADLMDPQQRILLEVAWQALEYAGIPSEKLKKSDTGVFVGVFSHDYENLLLKNLKPEEFGIYFGTGNSEAVLAGRLSYAFGLQGPAIVVNTACSSSLVAVHLACKSLLQGECHTALAAGVNVILLPELSESFAKGGMLAADGKCKTFDATADGYVRGEGCGVLVLKKLSDALTDKNQILAVIRGSAINQDGTSNGLTAPNENAQELLLNNTLISANIEPNQISYIECHGTGTSLGDPIEVKAINAVYGKNRDSSNPLILGSVKTNIGHTEGAAGIAGLIKTVLALQHHQIPPNLHFTKINPFIDLGGTSLIFPVTLMTWTAPNDAIRYAGISSFGFSGTNAHLILEEFQSVDNKITKQKSHYLITLSAKTDNALKQKIIDMGDWIKNKKKLRDMDGKQEYSFTLENLSYSLNVGRSHFEKRCIIIASSIEELQETLLAARENIPRENILYNGEITSNTNNKKLTPNLIQKLLNIDSDKNRYRKKLFRIAKSYVNGFDIDWRLIHNDESNKQIDVPTYPFEREHFWFHIHQKKVSSFKNHRHSPNKKISLQKINKKQQEINPQLNSSFPTINKLQALIETILYLPNEKISLTKSFSEMGMDSVLGVEFIKKINQTYRLNLSATKLYDYPTIESLSNYIDHQLSNPNKIIINSVDDSPEISFSDYTSIAIIGISCQFPDAKNSNEFWSNLIKGKSSITEIPNTRWDINEFFDKDRTKINKTYSKWGGFLSDIDKFDPLFFGISPAEADLMDPQQRILIQTAWSALEDAGYSMDTLSRRTCGLIMGVMNNDYLELILKSQADRNAQELIGNSNSILAGRIAYFLNFKGPTITLDTACSSSLVATHMACQILKEGDADIMLAGGVTLYLTETPYIGMSKAGMLSPDGKCNTFDDNADGFVPGEGVGVIVLKRLKDAINDGDHIYGIIKGSSVNQDGRTNGLTAPSKSSQKKLLTKIYKQFNINPETITYVEAHGTGTKLGDPIEVEALSESFGEYTKKTQFCAIGSVKTNIGHTSAAAGIASLIKVLLSLKFKKLVPSLNYHTPNRHIKFQETPFYVNTELKNWETIKRIAAISSFGFSGTNAHLVIEECDSENATIDSKSHYLLTFSAKSKVSLNQRIIDLDEWLNNHDILSLEDISYTLNLCRTHFPVRYALVVGSISELKERLIDLKHNENFIQNQKISVSLSNLWDQNNRLSDQPHTEYRKKLMILAESYINGDEIDFNNLHEGEAHKKISLPTYPFEKKSCWFVKGTGDENIFGQKKLMETNLPKRVKELSLGKTTKKYLKKIFSKITKIPFTDIKNDINLEQYGIDSIMILNFNAELAKDLPRIRKTLLFEFQTIDSLASYLIKKYPKELKSLFQIKQSYVPAEVKDVKVKNIVLDKNETSEKQNAIAIIGLSGCFPQAQNLEQLWEKLKIGHDFIVEIPIERWDYNLYYDQEHDKPGKTYSKWGSFLTDIDKFDPLFFNILPRDAERMDPQERLLLQSSWSAIEDAGYDPFSLQETGGHVGVFIGVMWNEYQLLSSFPSQTSSGNSNNSSLANRISYFLNLHGPSLVIDTACSSSLAAVHLACQHILSGQCNYAIAGGVNLLLHPSKYIYLSELGMLSSKGRCNSFGEDADGYVPGEGVGVMLLKSLNDAIRDNDHIYGVIKGSSINHGGKTSGYTVPNPIAQSNVIREALKNANVDAQSISYIEAHGTGTNLGDPIEITGLTNAFDSKIEKQFCAIGSIKSNLGHLEGAAGIAALIKVILQLKHQQLVPSIHTERLNSNINFEDTAFYVNRKLGDWKSIPGYPRRAGISSFGAGGTNVHMIIDEYFGDVLEHIDKPYYLITISAKTDNSLKHRLSDLEEWLTNNNGRYSTKDISFTLNVGRTHFEKRCAFVVKSNGELLTKLRQLINEIKSKDNIKNIFPIKLHELKINDEVIDDNLIQIEYYKMLTELADYYVEGGKIDWNKLYNEDSKKKISLPTYPFEKVQCWINQSDTSQKIVEKIDIKFNAKYFSDHKINKKKIVPGSTYLQWVYKVALKSCSSSIKSIKDVVWRKPIIISDSNEFIYVSLLKSQEKIDFQFFSNIEGEIINYCDGILSHEFEPLTNRVDFKKINLRDFKSLDVDQFTRWFERVGLYYGSSFQVNKKISYNEKEILAELELPFSLSDHNLMLHPSLIDGSLRLIALRQYLENIDFGLYVPFSMDALNIHRPFTRKCYAYIHSRSKKYDITIFNDSKEVSLEIKGFSVKRLASSEKSLDVADVVLFRPQWNLQQLIYADFPEKPTLLIFANDKFDANIIENLKAHVIVIRPGDTYQKINNNEYVIQPNIQSDYLYLFKDLIEKKVNISNIIHLWNIVIKSDFNYKKNRKLRLQSGIYSLLCLFKAFDQVEKYQDNLRLLFVFSSKEVDSLPEYESAIGLMHGLKLLKPDWLSANIQISFQGLNFKHLLQCLLREIQALNHKSPKEIRYESNNRLIRQLEIIQNPINNKQTLNSLIKNKGIYLITGGLGGLGKQFSAFLAKKYKARLILMNRSSLSSDARIHIKKLEKLGAEVLFFKGDVSSLNDVKKMFHEVKRKFTKLDGIIHAAGTIDFTPFNQINLSTFTNNLAAKVNGAVNLDLVTKNENLDFFIMFSSIASEIGDYGGGSYSAGNRFMDSYAVKRNKLKLQGKRSGISLSINWPYWKEGAMQLPETEKALYYKFYEMKALETETGMALFELCLGLPYNQIGVAEGNYNKIKRLFTLQPSSHKQLIKSPQPAEENKILIHDLFPLIEAYLKDVFSRLTRITTNDINTKKKFEDYGLDSITILKFNKEISNDFKDLPKTLLFEYTTINDLANYFIHEQKNQLIRHFKPKAKNEVNEKGQEIEILQSSADIQGELENKDNDGIAIIGLAGRYPFSKNLEEFWENLKNGKDCIIEIPKERWDYNLYYDPDKTVIGKTNSKWGSFLADIDKFDPLFFNIAPNDANLIDPQERLFLETAWSTIEDAGYSQDSLAGKQIGVFVGVMYSEYQILGVEENLKGNVNPAVSSAASIANRVSYFLDFHGPSIGLDTMCSSSLTAIQLACDNIQLGRCEMAVAGGVNLSIHPNKYLLLSSGKFLSSDGFCHTFGEGGDGYVPGEGVGAILLKSVRQALIDGDHIYGVIKGGSINHGGHSHGYTVPSPIAQTKVIKDAFKNAKISPNSISYIEAHGTGTSLGDPIEIKGLENVFKIDREDKCPIGSVKSNIGHLESAAGIAGLTKILLQFNHRALVPSIHAEKLNPNINFANSVFKVQKTLGTWNPIPGYPLRACISSFGAGGSNAHLIVEEPPTIDNTAHPNKPYYLITLSAKSEVSFFNKIAELIEWLQNNKTQFSIEDISFTLNIGRSHFGKRAALVVNSIENLIETLQIIKKNKKADNSFINLSFIETSTNETIFQKVIDKILLALSSPLSEKEYYDSLLVIANLYVKHYNINWNLLHKGESRKRISLPTYPFLRVSCWIKTPTHSSEAPEATLNIAENHNKVGELYDNVLLLETEEKFKNQNFLSFGILTEKVHGFSWSTSFLSGKDSDLLLRAQYYLREILFRRINFNKCKKVLDFGCGYGSDLISLAEKYPINRLDGYTLSQKQLEKANNSIKSHNLASRINVYQCDSATVDFPETYDLIFGIEVVHHIKDKNKLFNNIQNHLRVNGNVVIADFISNRDFPIEHTITSSYFITNIEWATLLSRYHLQLIECIDVSKEISNFLEDSEFEKNKLLFVKPDVREAFLSYHQLQKLLLEKTVSYALMTIFYQPNMQYEELLQSNKTILNNIIPFKIIENPIQWFYKLIWEKKDIIPFNNTEHFLIITDKINKKLVSLLQNKISSTVIYVDSTSEIDWNTVFDKYHNLRSIGHIIYILTQDVNNTDMLLTTYQTNCLKFLHFAKSISENIYVPVKLWLVTFKSPFTFYAIASMAKTLSIENSLISCTTLDCNLDEVHAPDAILSVIGTCDTEKEVAVSIEKNMIVLKVHALKSVKIQFPSMKTHFSPNSTCLITGGLGGLGINLTNWLASQGFRNFLLLGRNIPSSETEEEISKLRSMGIVVQTEQIDITDIKQLAKIVDTSKYNLPPIRYVIHAAGVISDASILNQTDENFIKVLLPKIEGAWNLHNLFKTLELDYFILFSSIASVFGSPGQINYAAANAFLDALSSYRQEIGLPTLTINWGPWAEVGMASRLGHTDHNVMIQKGIYDMAVSQGLIAFGEALKKNNERFVVAAIDWSRFDFDETTTNRFTMNSVAKHQLNIDNFQVNQILDIIRYHVSQLTGIELHELNNKNTFEELGIDSVKAINLRNRIQTAFMNFELSTSIFLEYPTIDKLYNYLSQIKLKPGTSAILSETKFSPSHVAPYKSITHQYYPLSFGQERIYFSYVLEPNNPSYNGSITYKIEGNLDLESLKKSCEALLKRHDILRSTFNKINGEIAAYTLPDVKLDFDLINAKDQKEIPKIIRNETHCLYDLMNGPLIRFRLIQLTSQLHFLIVAMNHMVTDGVSYVILMRDLAALYNSFKTNSSSLLPKLPIQYKDFSMRQRKWVISDEAKHQIEFWRDALRNIPTFLRLPIDKKRSLINYHHMDVYSFMIPNELTQLLKQFGLKYSVSLFSSLFSIYQLWLSMLSNQRQFIVGILIAGRNQADLENLIGFFLNILPIPVNLSDGPNFVNLTKRVNETMKLALSNQDIPFEILLSELNVNRTPRANPLIQTVFVFQNFLETLPQFEGLSVSKFNIDNGSSNDDLVLEVRPLNFELEILIKYNRDLFLTSTIEKMSFDFISLLTKSLEESDIFSVNNKIKKSLVIASSFTAEPLREIIQLWFDKISISTKIHFAPYNQLFQELLNPNSLLRTNSGINIILLRIEDWPSIKTVDEFIEAIKDYSNETKTSLMLCICPPSPQFLENFMEQSQYKVLETKIETSLDKTPSVYVISQADYKKYTVGNYYDPITDASGHIPYTQSFFTVLGTVIARKIHSILSPPRKVIVLDADNTLWKGVLGEDGIDGIQLTPAYIALQEFMVKQYEAGMLLCLCTKNNEEDVMNFFERYPDAPLKKHHLTSWRINWQPKSERIKQLAQELNLGLDSFIFMDDNVVECAEVKANCPQVLTLQLPLDEAKIPEFLNHVWAFDHARVTETDKQRTVLYQQNRVREESRRSATSFADFINSLELDISIDQLTQENIGRISQLTKRTTQFNTTGLTKSESDLQNLLNPNLTEFCLTIHVSDRFGDYGLVGAVFYRINESKLLVDNLLLSCRVLGKGIEHKIISELGRIATENKCSIIVINYKTSNRNAPVKLFLESLPLDKEKSTLNEFYLPVDNAITFKFSPEETNIESDAPVVDQHETSPSHFLIDSDLAQTIATELAGPETILNIINKNMMTERKVISTKELIPPHSALEQKIEKVMSQLLHLDKVSVNDNFFEMGATSLMMVHAQSQLQHELNYEIPLIEFFNHPTIVSLADFISTPNYDKNKGNGYTRAMRQLEVRKSRSQAKLNRTGSA